MSSLKTRPEKRHVIQCRACSGLVAVVRARAPLLETLCAYKEHARIYHRGDLPDVALDIIFACRCREPADRGGPYCATCGGRLRVELTV